MKLSRYFNRLSPFSGFSLAAPQDLPHCDDAPGRPQRAPGRGPGEEYQRLKKIRIVDLLEGKTARVLAILVLVVIVFVLAFIMSQTA